MGHPKTKELFIQQCNKVHNEKYDYSLVNYVNNCTKVIILCPFHGRFAQTPAKHLCQKTECPDCSKIKSASKRTSNTKNFIKKARSIHKNKYNYSLVNYKTAIIKVIIVCSEHGPFTQTPNDHLSGYGCSKCGRKGGYDGTFFKNHPKYKNRTALIYLVEYNIQEEKFLKIGITIRTIEERFNNCANHVLSIIKTVPTKLYQAYQFEQYLLQKYKTYKVYPIKLNKNAGGHTECFLPQTYSLLLDELKQFQNTV